MSPSNFFHGKSLDLSCAQARCCKMFFFFFLFPRRNNAGSEVCAWSSLWIAVTQTSTEAAQGFLT